MERNGTTSTDTGVVYVVGWGRSGSTLLDNVLGELDEFVSVGELASLWGQIRAGARCGCGEPVAHCEFWARVLDGAFGKGGRTLDFAHRASELVHRVVRLRKVWRILRYTPLESRPWPELDSYVDLLSDLYSGISAVSGARVIVDSSKNPAGAAVLRLVHDINPYFVQLVRDPRAVAFSWQRSVALPEFEGRREMGRPSPIRSSVQWTTCNLAAQAVRNRELERSLLMRYETFVQAPRESVERILFLAGRQSDLAFVQGSSVSLGRNHTVGGNPSRFRTGTVKLRLDDEWRTKQMSVERVLATIPALPLLNQYGYSLRTTSGTRRRSTT